MVLLPVVAPPVKIAFGETLRRESLTQGFANDNTTTSAQRGRWAVRVDAPLPRTPPTAATRVYLKLGTLELDRKLGDDPAWRPSAKTARLTLTETRGEVTVELAAATLDWRRGRLTMKMDGRTPSVRPLVADTLLREPDGAVAGSVTVQFAFGDDLAALTLPFKGRLVRKSAGGEGIYGEAITVDVKSVP